MPSLGVVSVVIALAALWFSIGWRRRRDREPLCGRIRIGNFARVSPTYFRGEQPQGDDYLDLAARDIRLVICLSGVDETRPDERALAAAAGMHFVHLPMNVHVPPTRQLIATFISLVDDPANQPVFVHCVGGRHRTGVMTAVYRMVHDGTSATDAFKEMKQFRYGPDFLHPEYKHFVLNFDRSGSAVPERATTCESPGRESQ